MKNTIILSILLLFAACGCSTSEEVVLPPPTPEEVLPPNPTSITIGDFSDTMEIGEIAKFAFSAAQNDHPEDFKVKVTTSPSTAQLSINGAEISDYTTITQGENHTLDFAPMAIGKYEIQLAISDKCDSVTIKNIEIVVKSHLTLFEVGTVPDSLAVESATNFTFSVAQKDHPEDFKIEVDTIVPRYFKYGRIIENEHTVFDEVFGSAEILLNGEEISEVSTIAPAIENTISFSNANTVGEYKIVIKITNKYDIVTSKELVLKTFSPPIEIKWFSQNLLRYMWESDAPYIYDNLNRDFSLNPLTKSLEGKEIDSLYTQEFLQSNGLTTSFPGAEILIHISQAGGQDMQCYHDFGDEFSTSSWYSEIDSNWSYEKSLEQGFHAIRLQTSDLSKVGTMHYTLKVLDKWGKEHRATLPYKCFGINENIPSWCINSDEIPFWWYTQAK